MPRSDDDDVCSRCINRGDAPEESVEQLDIPELRLALATQPHLVGYSPRDKPPSSRGKMIIVENDHAESWRERRLGITAESVTGVHRTTIFHSPGAGPIGNVAACDYGKSPMRARRAGYIVPCVSVHRAAKEISSALLAIRIFSLMWARWTSTVFGLMCRWSAMRVLSLPFPMSWKISNSRSVRRSTGEMSVRCPAKRLDHLRGNRRTDGGLARQHLSNRRDEPFAALGFHDVTTSAGAQHALGVERLVVGGKRKDGDLRMLHLKILDEFQSVLAANVDVHHREIGLRAGGEFQRDKCVAGLATDSRSGSLLMTSASPSRMIAWSSTIRMRFFGGAEWRSAFRGGEVFIALLERCR